MDLPDPDFHLHPLYVVALTVYFLALLGVGIYFSRKQRSEEMYFLAGRKMPWFLAGISVLATLLSTISYLSLPGEMIKNGVGFFYGFIGLALVIPIVNYIIIPALMRLPVTTVYDFFERRFGLSTRVLSAIVFIVMRLTWIGIITYTASFAVSEMTGWDVAWIAVGVGVVTLFYTTTGGMTAVVWCDFAQFVLLFGGAIFIPVYIGFQTDAGPVEWWDTFSQAGRSEVVFFSFDPEVRITVVGMILVILLWNLSTHSADQVAAQRYLSTPSAGAARRSMWVYSVTNLFLSALLALCGLALFFFYFREGGLPVEAFAKEIREDADGVLPRFIVQELPAGHSGLMLAAILAAAMSSLSSGIHSISTVAVNDFFNRFRSGGSQDPRPRIAQLIALAAGAIAILLAIWLEILIRNMKEWNLIDLIERVNHLFVAPLGALFLIGVLLRRVSEVPALIGFAAGVLTSFLVSFSEPIFDEPIAWTWIMPAAFVVTIVVAFATGPFFPPPAPSKLAAVSPSTAAEEFDNVEE